MLDEFKEHTENSKLYEMVEVCEGITEEVKQLRDTLLKLPVWTVAVMELDERACSYVVTHVEFSMHHYAMERKPSVYYETVGPQWALEWLSTL